MTLAMHIGKKILLVRICLLFVLLMIYQSNVSAQNIKIGFKGGASFANFFNHNASGEQVEHTLSTIILTPDPSSQQPTPVTNTTTIEDYNTNFFNDMRTGFFSGLYMDIKLNEKWTIEAGLGYSQKGIILKYKTSNTVVNDDNTTTKQNRRMTRTVHTNYITLPGVFKYTIGKKQRFYTVAGVYTAFGISSKFKAWNYTVEERYTSTGSPSTVSRAESSMNKSYVRVIDVGLVGGGGYEIPINEKWSMGIDVRMNIGLLNVPAKYDEVGYLTFSATTKNINIETGIKISYSL